MKQEAAACPVCGDITDLVRVHLSPARRLRVGVDRIDRSNDFGFVCKNCQMTLGLPPTEAEFVAFLAYLLREAPRYSDVVQESVIGTGVRYRADILATRRDGAVTERLLIECKSSRYFAVGVIEDAIAQLRRYKEIYGECRLVLAIPVTLNDGEKAKLLDADVELWDLEYLSSTFFDQINSSFHGYYRTLLLSKAWRGSVKTRESALRDELKACPPGIKDWNVYQSLVGDILEHLFCPALGKPISEHSDWTKTNRRDFILPNYSEAGFWSFMRDKYMADYLVVDAKNSGKKIKKEAVLQVANYLKPHGAGLFGVIVSRTGEDASGCKHTLREQWLVHKKLILVFDDIEIDAMLSAKEDRRAPEEVIGKKIEQFRLSM
ncbi:hypothetical protein MRS60_05435 [Burkholderia pyrrocinia]|uniref:hypothetical protein n=1 Tax=Burkholderia pyrrocinia TaxID=60550 RepID=UPI001FB1CA16|nr:hypothetical protein [Burkholderia pyrrocinia]UOB56546.1 hypothetical protein MRS60_05435 [Burkholderia pyrrocinia]